MSRRGVTLARMIRVYADLESGARCITFKDEAGPGAARARARVRRRGARTSWALLTSSGTFHGRKPDPAGTAGPASEPDARVRRRAGPRSPVPEIEWPPARIVDCSLGRWPRTLARGREAYERRAWAESCALLSAADRQHPRPGRSRAPRDGRLSRWPRGRQSSAWARAHQERLARGEVERAVRCAFGSRSPR